VERQAKDFSEEQRLALRRAQSVPVFAQLREKLLGWKQPLLPMAEAINYALNQWAERNVFCSDDAVPTDSNVSEREMKAHRTEPRELFVRWQFSPRANRGDPGQLNQHLSPARGGSPDLSHAAVP